jgi:hypothetical protein
VEVNLLEGSTMLDLLRNSTDELSPYPSAASLNFHTAAEKKRVQKEQARVARRLRREDNERYALDLANGEGDHGVGGGNLCTFACSLCNESGCMRLSREELAQHYSEHPHKAKMEANEREQWNRLGIKPHAYPGTHQKVASCMSNEAAVKELYSESEGSAASCGIGPHSAVRGQGHCALKDAAQLAKALSKLGKRHL